MPAWAKGFVYAEGRLKGILIVTGLFGLSPNLTSRLAPGMLIRICRPV
ncbi:MAG: hypothetical protein LUO89_03890 [Methanothrix sp.]|nr:hypothetical protein [Methanothrix sp.]